MALRNRGQEVTVRIIVDGKARKGSMARVLNWKLTPRIDQMEVDFLGEKFTEIDQQVHGFDFSFQVHEADDECATLLDTLVANEGNGIAPPSINIVVTKKYRDAGRSARVEVLERCVLKPSEDSAGGRKDWVSWSWEGKAKTRRQLPNT